MNGTSFFRLAHREFVYQQNVYILFNCSKSTFSLCRKQESHLEKTATIAEIIILNKQFVELAEDIWKFRMVILI